MEPYIRHTTKLTKQQDYDYMEQTATDKDRESLRRRPYILEAEYRRQELLKTRGK